MNWFFVALANPVAHALVNHLDKYIISRYLKGQVVGALVLVTALVAAAALPVMFIFNPDVLTAMSFHQGLTLALNGCLIVIATIFYFYALEAEEASYVVPFFQLIPVFGFALGYLVLGETLTHPQILGSALIVVGGILLSFRYSGGRVSVPARIVAYMLIASLAYALNAAIFKSIAAHQGFFDSLFWDMAGKFGFGVLLFAFIGSYRRALIRLIRVNRWTIISLSFFTEALGTFGEVAAILAVLYAPVALVQAVGGLQPLFVLVIGVLLTVLVPRLGRESLSRGNLVQKMVGIAIMLVGTYMIGG